jgi:deoxycytidylate deaminase
MADTNQNQEIKYPYMPEGRSIGFVTLDNQFMKEAKFECDNHSTDHNHSTGAVAVLDNKIIGRASNQSALRNKKLLKIHKDGLCIRRILKIPSGQKYWLCPGCASHRNHAEWGAVRDALKRNKSIEGADLYLYGHWWCCKPCWDAMVGAGIRDVYVLEGAYGLFK